MMHLSRVGPEIVEYAPVTSGTELKSVGLHHDAWIELGQPITISVTVEAGVKHKAKP